MAHITIKKFRKSDATFVLDMVCKLAAFHGDTTHVSATQIIKHCIGPHKLALCWLVWHQKQAIGFAIAYDWMNFPKGKMTRHLDLIYIEESYRNQGIGQILVKHIAREAIQKGCKKFNVGALKENVAANEFYKTLGFEEGVNLAVQYKIQDYALSDLAKS